MSRRNAIARGALAALAGAALAAPSVLADHWELIPHGIGWNAVDSTPEKPPGVQHYWGGGHWIQWDLHEGATLYFVDSHTYYYDEVHSPPDTRRPTGGGSWGAYSEAEFVAQLVPPGLSTWFDVWAYFPAKGNLRVEKKADVFGPVRPGEVVHYTLRYRNVGTKPIADAILEETIPSYMEHVSGGFPTGRKVSWTLGRLAPGQGGFVTVSMRLSEDIPPDVSRVHNVAVTKRDPDPPVPPPDTDAPPDETSDPAGAFVSRGDALVCRAASGDSEWMDTPAATEFAPLELLDVVRGGDQVRIPGGAADFRHTLADGTLSIVQGGFSMAPASELPRDAFSEIRVEPGSVFGHDVHGILNPAEYVAVQTPHLAMRINVGAYRFADAAGKETVTVTGGDVYVVDPESVEHKVSAGTTFEWPPSHSPAAGGPQIAGTTPADRTGVPWNDMTMTFAFDEPVTSIGAASRLAIHSEPEIASWSGTLDDLSAGGIITMSWNAAHDALTIRPLRPAGYATPGALWFALTLRDVVGASGTTALITKPMRLYRTDVTDGSGNLSGTWDHLAVSHTAGGLQTLQWYEVAQLDAPPVGLPASLAAATPVYTFRYLGAAAGTTKVSLRAGTRVPLPASAAAPGGLHRLVDGTWQRVTAGFGGEWTSADLAGTEFTVALLAPSIAFDPPVVTSVRPAPGAASADPGDPIVIEVLAPFGIDRKVTQVFVNGTRAFRYDPVHDTLPGWTIDEADGVTKLTYAPTLPWTAGACVYGQVVTASAYSGLAVRRDFAFNVKYSGRKDADRDWMPDAWESANGTAVGRNDRSEDLDGDGFSNQLECELGTSPQSSASAPFVGEMSAGTVGSHFRISRTGKAVKGVAVFVSPRIVRAKSKTTRAKVGRWIGDSATFELTSPLVPGAYDVWARVPKAPAARIGEIEIAGPAIDAVDPASGAANSRATILGSMFGTREPVVRLVSTATQKRTTCRVTKTTMDVRTGASRVAFVVPKVPAGTYQIVLDNRVDRATAEFVVR